MSSQKNLFVKSFLLLAAALMIFASINTALSEGFNTSYTPSKSFTNLANVVGIIFEYTPTATPAPTKKPSSGSSSSSSGGSTTPEPSYKLTLVSDQLVAAKVIRDEATKIAAFVAAGQPVANFFDRDVLKPQNLLERLRWLLPANFNLDNLEMLEFYPVSGSGYTRSLGNINATLEFPTQYSRSQQLVAMVGVAKHTLFSGTGNSVEELYWTPLKATVVSHPLEYGKTAVQVEFTEDVLVDINYYQSNPVCLAILSN